MKNVILLAVSTFFLININAQSWQTNKVFSNNQTIKDVHVINDSIVLAVSALYSGTGLQVKKTSNNGLTWTEIQTGVTAGISFYNIASINDGKDVFIVGSLTTLIQSTDYGDTWTQKVISFPNISHLRDIMFVNDLVGFIVGDNAKVLKTVDGGQTWTDQNAVISGVNTIGGVFFINENDGYVYGFNFFKETHDSGLNWVDVVGYSPMAGTPFQIQEVDFLTPLIGYASGDVGFLTKTIDGGQSWVQMDVIIPSYLTESLFDFEFLEDYPNYGFACGYHGLVIRTYDGGTTWELMNSDIPGTNQTVNYASTFSCMDFNGNKGFMGYPKTILTYEEIGLSTGDLKNKLNEIKLFPNPVSSELFFSAKLDKITKLEIYNTFGQLMYKNINVTSNYISCENLESGFYFLRMTSNNNTVSKQFIKE